METANYFTKRARQERTNAVRATSAEARTAHLELAVRLVRVATQPVVAITWPAGPRLDEIAFNFIRVLHLAFPTPKDDAFEQLLASLGRRPRT